jgi:hypothetical protein
MVVCCARKDTGHQRTALQMTKANIHEDRKRFFICAPERAWREQWSVDAAARIKSEIGNDFTLPPLASNDLLCGSNSDESAVFDVLTKDDAHTIDIG